MKKITALKTLVTSLTIICIAFICTQVNLPFANAQDTHEHTTEEQNLEQTVESNELIAPQGEQTVISDGHADLGAIFINDTLDFLMRDDTTQTPVWRHLDDVVFNITDNAKQQLPQNGEYDFVGAKGGETIWAVPQTQIAKVPWLGWNTQSPTITSKVSRGVTLEFIAHQGAGNFSAFLQSGGFDKPQELWNSSKKEIQPIWVDLHTHTHANWVFTKPGIHLIKLNIKVKLIDGSEKNVSRILRFAVSESKPELAFQTQWEENNVADEKSETVIETSTLEESPTRHADSSIPAITLLASTLIIVGVCFTIIAYLIHKRSMNAQQLAKTQYENHDSENKQ
ncbi:MAG: choice-of-anchor M domain-containing protein [Bifidobacteriaceae bacterium]|nr:choice-of-anchor M domain-containing protein [Bifidobacteriaceae bacterium]